MLKKYFLSFSIVLTCMLSTPPGISSEKNHTLSGFALLWEKKICNNHECGLPKRMRQPWPIEAQLQKPQRENTLTKLTETFQHEDLSVQITFYWVLKAKIKEPYVITRILLTHKEQGLIAECNRYDYLEELHPFPVGICSGKLDELQVGVSLGQNFSKIIDLD